MKLFDMGISISSKRLVHSFSLSDNTTITSWGAIHIKFGNSDFFPSSFCIESKDVIVYIDPVKIESTKTADYIFITHSHPDHFSLEDIAKTADQETMIICPGNAAKKLKGFKVREVSPQDTIELRHVGCEVVSAHSLGFPSHPKWRKNVGYVLTIGGQRIYHAGDTDLIKEIQRLKNIDVAFVPIDGDNLTMKTAEAAELIKKLKPKIAIPMHYEVGMNKAHEFKELIGEGSKAVIFAE